MRVAFLGLAVVNASRYHRTHGGWDIATGSNDPMAVMPIDG